MECIVDDVWASPSTLHLRVTVHGDDFRWRHRFYEAVPLETIPKEALEAMIAYWVADEASAYESDTPLF